MTLQLGAAGSSLSVSPTSKTIHASTALQLTATTENVTNPTIVWYVNDVKGGADSTGTISDTGLFTAPAAVPDTNPVIVKVVLMVSPDPASKSDITRTVKITITNPIPAITGITPARIKPGDFTLILTGTGLMSSSTAAFKGAPLTVTSVTPTSMTVTGTSTDAGTQLVTVSNPDPGKTTSAPAAFTISNTMTPAMSLTEASRFLNYATFGPTRSSVDELQTLGYQQWLAQQFDAVPSVYPATLDAQGLDWAQSQFFRNAMTGADQLRQRMAFALHQIFVVSGVKVDDAHSYVPYLRTLQSDAFANYRQVMGDITLSPAMGEFLDMVNNDKVDLKSGASPNENYARELMQLFTLGLAQLNPDGTAQTDDSGNPIPPYSQADVTEFARVFTGWTYPPRGTRTTRGHNSANYSGPMVFYEPNHDDGAKQLLNGVELPANNGAQRDLDAALDNIFNHPNVGPFVAKNLIQHFVTSNPSPAYVGRVAASFNDSGGVRGDLKAVITAILMDDEALNPPATTGGHLREPVLFTASVMRALSGTIADHPFLSDSSEMMGQKLLYAGSVFNYFSPGYRILNGSLAAPEFQILTAQTVIERVNYVGNLIYGNFGSEVKLDINRFVNAAADANVLVDMVDAEIMGGQMSADVRSAILTAVQAQSGARAKARAALYLAATSSQYQIIH